MASAPIAANVSGQSEIWPAYPMSGTSDAPTRATPKSWPSVCASASLTAAATRAVTTTTTPAAINVPRYVGLGITSRVRNDVWPGER